MQKPRLIASDVDGTLLDSLERVSRRTRRVIDRAQAAGIPFVLVSGRPPRWIPMVARAVGTNGYAVCANGAVVYDIATDRVVSAHTIDPITLHDVAHALTRAMPEVRFAVERPGGAHTPTFATEPGYHNPWGDVEVNSAPRAELVGHPASKLLVRHQGLTSGELASAVASLLGDAVDVTYSTNLGLVELSRRGVTKAVGLAEVAGFAGVHAADVVAFGDMPNDIEMLRWAGHGVAVANAHPDVLAAADEVTASNSEHGVAQVLERWF